MPRNAQCSQLCPSLECGQPAFRGTTAGGGEGTRGEPEAKRHSTSSATLSTRRQRAKAAAATSTLDLALDTLDLSDGWVCGVCVVIDECRWLMCVIDGWMGDGCVCVFSLCVVDGWMGG